MVEETSFPRGSSRPVTKDIETSDSKKLRPSQKRKSVSGNSSTPTASSVKKDVLFGSSKKKDDGKLSSSKRRKTEDAPSNSNSKNSLMPLGGGGVVVSTEKKKHKEGDSTSVSATSVHIESLGFSKIAKGSKVLACVREVHEHYAIVSLPNLLTAYILSQNKAGQPPKYPLVNTLQVGQTLAVVVTKIAIEQVKEGQSRRRIQVSALPQVVNPRFLLTGESGDKGTSITSAANRLARAAVPLRGQIHSIEDHGCIVEMGFGKRGFLRFDRVGDSNGKGINYVILEEDEEYEEEEDDDPSKRPIILQKGRIYDFLVLPVTTNLEEDSSTSIFPLSLPTKQTMAKKTVSSLTSNIANGGGKRGKNRTTTIPFSFSSLMPGWLVQVKVEAIANNGLCVSLFGNIFRGAIEINHLGATLIPDGAAANGRDKGFRKLAGSLFQEHQNFSARILAIDVPTKLVRLSIVPHILSLSHARDCANPLQEFPSIGTVVSDCTVVKLDPGIGALLALPPQYNVNTTSLAPKSLVDSCDLFQNVDFQEASHIRKVYVHISKAFDESEEGDAENNAAVIGKFHKEFTPSSTHDVRILSTGHWLDGIAAGGCASSIIKAPVLTHEDLIPGRVYKQVPICAHLKGGSVLVQLGGGTGRSGKKNKSKSSGSHQISGLIPPMQLFDVVSNESSEYRQRVFKTKYAVDAKVDVRVLWVDPLKKKCLVTAKKSIVQASQEDIITNYNDVKVGQLAVGFVSKVDDQGLFITFCNRVYGKVTARSLAAELGVEDHRDNYSVGDVVTSRVVKKKEVVRKNSTIDEDNDYEMDDDNDDETQSSSRRKHWELTLSLKVHQDEDDEVVEVDIDKHNTKQVRLLAGAILPEKSMKIVEFVDGKTKKSGGYNPGYAIVSIKSKYLVDQDSLGKSKMLSYIECKLPYSHLLDSFDPADVQSAEKLDAFAKRVLTVGKKIKQKGLILEDPRKQIVDYASGIGTMPVVSLRKTLIQNREDKLNSKEGQSEKAPILPLPDSNLYVGAHLLGFVAQVDKRHGAFIRFLDGMTGMVPKRNGGLELHLYETLVTKVTVIDDSVHPYRFLLEPVHGDDAPRNLKQQNHTHLKPGDIISEAKLSSIGFEQATLTTGPNKDRLYLHCTGTSSDVSVIRRRKKLSKQSPSSKLVISTCHPFYGLETGQTLNDLTVVSVQRNKIWVVNKKSDEDARGDPSTFIEKASQLKVGMKVRGIVAAHGKDNSGIFVRVGPQVTGFVSGLELSRDVKLLNDLQSNIPLGAVIECMVTKLKAKRTSDDPFLLLSVLTCDSNSALIPKPSGGDLVVGRINRSLDPVFAPSLMLDLRQGTGRCCITELDEPDEWGNMPLGQQKHLNENNDEDMNEIEATDGIDDNHDGTFANKKYVECRVLNVMSNGKVVDVSLRSGRINGDLDDDPAPTTGDIVQGYVIQTTKKGCFVRFSRTVEGRSTLKELCDGYIANPNSSFPMGRLVVGKIKETRPVSKKQGKMKDPVIIQADVDMRESVLAENDENLLSFEDIDVGMKYKGTVQTVTSYGVFVRIENSNLDGLVHLSESSDNFVKDLQNLYSPGDLVKVLVIKKDDETKKLGFSMKASHFEDDDTDDSSVDSDVDMEDSDDDINDERMEIEIDSNEDLDSDDENFASKLAKKIDDGDGDDDDSDEDEDEDEHSVSSEEDSSSSDDESHSGEKEKEDSLDTNVGFSWGASALKKETVLGTGKDEDDESDESDSDSDDEDPENVKSNSRRSRKRQALKRIEEQETSRRETALADGTADDNPETVGDFERLLAGDPNNSELWIRYMAFHLSLADIPSARKVAEKALERIEFRQEKEKLNVWSAVLTLEHKFGNDDTFKDAIERACKQSNPKHVYLRACEIRAKEIESSGKDPTSVSKADALFKTMCKKHKSKKKAWLAYLEYLLKQSRHGDAQDLMKRAMLSLATHKHAEIMSKYAQMEFELGNPERGRTIFDGLVLKYAKRLDLFFVYVDKECKFGSIDHARTIIEKKVEERKLSDRQMKSLFKKWYRLEEEHGTEESKEHVKESARTFVTSSRN